MKHIKNKIKIAALAGLSSLAVACASSQKTHSSDAVASKADNNEMDNNYLTLSAEQRSAVNATNNFAIQLFKTQHGMTSSVISPLSVSYLMGILANGANADTQKQILATLGFNDISLQDINEAYKALINHATRCDKSTTINIANYVAVNDGVTLNANFKNTATQMFDAEIQNLDFKSAKAVEIINGWCNKQTNGMIPNIISQLDANATSVLMNAIYFNGTWASKFDKSNTKEENFQGYTRDIKRLKMMHQEDNFLYANNNTFSAIKLPYGNGNYSMIVLLPNNGKSIEDMLAILDTDALDHLQRDMEECLVDLKLPKFTTTTELQLNTPITKLGAPLMFDASKADFSNLSANHFHVSQMLQKAKIEVGEEGTKAAAVTAAVMLTSLEPREPRRVQFHANRPFVYMITEADSNAIFFIGKFTGSED